MIAARESDSGDIQFAGNSDGHRLKSAIEDDLAESAVRRSEIDLLAGRDGGVAEVAGDGGFGGSVDVDERSSRRQVRTRSAEGASPPTVMVVSSSIPSGSTTSALQA